MTRVFVPWNNQWIDPPCYEDYAIFLKAWVHFLASPDEMTKPLMSWWVELVEIV